MFCKMLYTADTIKEVARCLDPIYALFKKYYFRIRHERRVARCVKAIYFTLWNNIHNNHPNVCETSETTYKALKLWYMIELEVMHIFWKIQRMEIHADFVLGKHRAKYY
ncbi:E4 ORF3 [Bat mastadenovirus WIV12]|uniref:E4 ORF3 n=1 Tax=Bat mastadenovirus WIV12 TaxID=1788434 RepID=A0A1B0UI08_9ADEN|nr:E4 ORF3 [Bat mastadenovirus WIV12]AMB43168.1 E4 ORF3 [Bat mastadenovirus WIV12]